MYSWIFQKATYDSSLSSIIFFSFFFLYPRMIIFDMLWTIIYFRKKLIEEKSKIIEKVKKNKYYMQFFSSFSSISCYSIFDGDIKMARRNTFMLELNSNTMQFKKIKKQKITNKMLAPSLNLDSRRCPILVKIHTVYSLCTRSSIVVNNSRLIRST